MAQSIYISLHDKGALVKLHKLGRSYHQRGSSFDSGTAKNRRKGFEGCHCRLSPESQQNHAEMY